MLSWHNCIVEYMYTTIQIFGASNGFVCLKEIIIFIQQWFI